jgi:hypothetical protein
MKRMAVLFFAFLPVVLAGQTGQVFFGTGVSIPKTGVSAPVLTGGGSFITPPLKDGVFIRVPASFTITFPERGNQTMSGLEAIQIGHKLKSLGLVAGLGAVQIMPQGKPSKYLFAQAGGVLIPIRGKIGVLLSGAHNPKGWAINITPCASFKRRR